MSFKKSLLLFIAAFLFFYGFAQDKKPGIISGIVKDAQTKTPIIEAVITLSSNTFQGQKFAITDSAGMYSIKDLRAGNYSIVFEMEGYEKSVRDSIALKEGMSFNVSLEMVREQKKKDKDQKVRKDATKAP
jgi:hypothetical protein